MDLTWKETEADRLLAAAHGPPEPVVLANPPDVKELTKVQQSAHAVLEQAKGLVIETADDYRIGGKIIAGCTLMTRELDALCRPNIKRLHDAKTAALADLKVHTIPLGEAKAIANGKMRAYDHAEENKRREAEAKLRETARLEEEARQLEHAVQLEKAGRVEEAEYVASKPVTAPIVHIESTVPKIAGQSIRKSWKARVVDASLVPDQYKVIDMTGLNALARSLKERAQVPGVEFYSEETTAQRRV